MLTRAHWTTDPFARLSRDMDRLFESMFSTGGGTPAAETRSRWFSAPLNLWEDDNNIYVETLGTGETMPVTMDGTRHLINGTFDWVYEEELDLRDGFRWSPDGAHIAYWQLDSNGIKDFYIINNTDGQIR